MNAWKFFRGLLNRSKPFFNLLWYYVKCTEYFCSNFEFFTFASVKKTNVLFMSLKHYTVVSNILISEWSSLYFQKSFSDNFRYRYEKSILCRSLRKINNGAEQCLLAP